MADDILPPWHRLESALQAASRGVRKAYDTALAEVGLNLTQAQFVAFVEEFGPITQTQLAEQLGLGRAGAGTVIDTLHELGIVSREPDDADRRVWLITLTAAGKEVAGDVARIDATVSKRLRDGLNRADRQELARLLLRLQANASNIAETWS